MTDQSHNTIAIILGRAGSKGLPNKNIALVAGKPMIQWTIDCALAAKTLDTVLVSTDGSKIVDVVTKCNIPICLRPAELASDTATVDAAARHALAFAEQRDNKIYDIVVILYANVPVRPLDLIDRAVTKLIDTGADSVQSVAEVGKHHPCWMKTLTGDNNDILQPYVENNIYRRQDLPPVYALDGGIIAVTRDSLQTVIDNQPHAFLGSKRRAVITRPGEVVDVDEPVDLAIAQAILSQKQQGGTR